MSIESSRAEYQALGKYVDSVFGDAVLPIWSVEEDHTHLLSEPSPTLARAQSN
jgi:hypothetical protein